MIVGKCTNPAGNHGTAERWDAAAPKGASVYSDAVSAQALVPQEKFRSQAVSRLNRPDALFVAHLIATAEQAPQTRILRRASIADAMSYYDTVTKVTSSASRIMTTGLSRVV